MNPGSSSAVSKRAHAVGAGRAYWFLGSLAIVHLAAEETGGACCVVQFQSAPDSTIPLHAYREASQTTYVLEGEITFHLPGGTDALDAGDCIHHTAGVPKTQRVTSAAPARDLDFNSPAGFDGFIAAVGEPAADLSLPPSRPMPDFERVTALAAEAGIEILGPPGELP